MQDPIIITLIFFLKNTCFSLNLIYKYHNEATYDADKAIKQNILIALIVKKTHQ